jgi:predicted DNA-binding ribbon-helix-helix protein
LPQTGTRIGKNPYPAHGGESRGKGSRQRSDGGPHRLRKRSVTIAGHATSLSLEAAFWDELKAIAGRRGLSLNKLIAEIDGARDLANPPANLSSAVRVYVLAHLKSSRG